MFTDEFRHRLELGKYTRWVTCLGPEHLLGLFWVLGEYGCRAETLSQRDALEKELLTIATKYGLNCRALVGMQLALQSACMQVHTVEEVKAAIRTAVDAMRAEEPNG